MNISNKKRLAKDVVDIIKNPLNDNNIYYIHDENDMLVGYALIIGPEDTLYNYGYYFFKFNFKKEYPYQPPRVEYLTNENNIRFHPNLYRNGKVCLSLLNTWNGEQWTSCQTIRTILLNLVTLFHNKPLLNEPGITEKYKYFNEYNEIIKYSNYNTAIISILKKKIIPKYHDIFKNIVLENYKKNKKNILKNIEILKNNKKNNKKLEISLYGRMTCNIDYDTIYEIFKKINI
jgi:ubiquitin-conjugating enzyme E2 Z